jgi:hypothetical protein
MTKAEPGIKAISTRRARSTGTIVSVIDNRDWGFATSDLPWITLCEDHGNYCSHETRQHAADWASAPEQWCATCQEATP